MLPDCEDGGSDAARDRETREVGFGAVLEHFVVGEVERMLGAPSAKLPTGWTYHVGAGNALVIPKDDRISVVFDANRVVRVEL